MSIIELIAIFMLGFWIAWTYAPEECGTPFETATGINYDSFLAAKTDCETFYKEPCRLSGGWAPKSSFRD